MMTGCGSDANSAASTDTDETLAEKLADNLGAGTYTVEMTISGDGYSTDMPCTMTACGGNGYVTMTIGGVYTEFYTVDGATYMVFPDIKCYQPTDDSGDFVNGLFVIGEGDSLTGSKTSDGKVTETYSSTDSEGEKETYTFVFDEKTELPVSFKSESEDETTSIVFGDVKWTADEISLPDLSGWVDVSDTDSLDESAQMKFSLYCLGVTEEDLKAQGYSYDDLDSLSDGEFSDLLGENGLNIFSTDDSSDAGDESADSE
jgi:hypothetical protein